MEQANSRFVSMNEHAEVDATEAVYTLGLCGCLCAVARRGSRVILAHYSPTNISGLYTLLKAFRPSHGFLWASGVWVKGESGRYTLEPDDLPEVLSYLPLKIIPYDTSVLCGEHSNAKGVFYSNETAVGFNQVHSLKATA